MALTTDQEVFFRRKLGTNTDLTDAETRYLRLGSEWLVVVEVLEERMATLVATPASFSIPGEYSQDTKENIRILERALADARAEAEAGEDIDENLVYIQAPFDDSPMFLDTESAAVRRHGRPDGR